MRFLLFGVFFILYAFSVKGQPDTNSAGAGASGSPGTVVWSNTGNITTSNNAYASAANGTTETITASNFGFALPANSSVDGIEVAIERYGQASNTITQGTWQSVVQPTYAGTDVYNSITYSNISTGSGSNRIMIVAVGIENVDNTATLDIVVDPVTVSYNGTAMTQIGFNSLASSTTRNWVGMYYLLEADLPTSGTNANLVVTKTRGATATVDDPEEYIEMVSINTFANVNQAFPLSSVTTTATGANTVTAGSALDVSIGDMLVTAVTGNSSGNPWTGTGAGYTVRTNVCENNTVTTGACMSVGTRAISTSGVADITPSASTGGGNHGRIALVGIVLQGARVFDNAVQIVKGGTVTGDNLSNGAASINVSWPETDATTTYGSATELWGETWLYSDINAADFGISFQADATNASAFIDHISITVHYTVTLPIDLISFDANYESRKVTCKATVYIDDNNDYTVITERSADGQLFSDVNETNFNLGYPSVHSFEVFDPEPYSGLSYYRLKLIDHFEGTAKYSKAKAVFAGEEVITDWKLYPNPTQNTVVIELANTTDQSHFQLYDISGKAIPFTATEQAKGRFIISPLFGGTWENGVYIFEAYHQNKLFRKRFVVNK